MSERHSVYLELAKYLANIGYAFICPSPETQARVVQRKKCQWENVDAKSVADFFGWNLSATRLSLSHIIPDDLVGALIIASVVVPEIVSGDTRYRSTIRVCNFDLPHFFSGDIRTSPLYYICSSFPGSPDSVFFGPDTYLFLSFLHRATKHLKEPPRSVIDVCCGAGAGAINLAQRYPQAKVCGLDLNPLALNLGRVNAELARTDIQFYESNLYKDIETKFEWADVDLIVSNPPYIASGVNGEDVPIYADGGAQLGLELPIRIVEEGLGLLSERGYIFIYTGVAISVERPGYDAFLEKLKKVKNAELTEYTIIQPDMWSEEIGKGAYTEVGRIQVVGAVVKRKGGN